MRRKSNEIILGIDPGSRHIGFAVFRRGELDDYGIKSIKQNSHPKTIRKLASVIRNLIDLEGANVVAVEIPVTYQQKSSLVAVVVEKIKSLVISEFGKYVNLKVVDPRIVKKAICDELKPTKANMAKKLAELFPQLRPKLDLPNPGQTNYHARVFDAIAMAYYCVYLENELPLPNA
ncbi:MAG: hypothetical protein DWQ47_11930 [Acidobacteria bacterium]|nr:MAG: hypothetical protein DWQ32_14345 [Acidobacteriota bacterium]REJ98280.1 MAG: hypothetical protein DWQ38_17145 [Acidobacteriota bacterium]REK17024.1 MAG: hypothetical protein DWQ43_02190 [Acidobacteriota bacterium]REK42934.1 MAG: hypothetical protein DWQ47_11930 [Acidobacteriota bacterium]